MSNETIYKYSTQVTAISGTANLASNGFNGSTEVSTSLSSTNHGNYPLADAVLFASFSTSISSASNIVNLYRRDKNIDGANHAPQPSSAASYSAVPVGQFIITPTTATSTSGYFPCVDVPLSAQCEFYIENKTNATIFGTTGSYTVKLTPKTYAPAP